MSSLKVHGVKRTSILHNLPYWKVMVELHFHIVYRIQSTCGLLEYNVMCIQFLKSHTQCNNGRI